MRSTGREVPGWTGLLLLLLASLIVAPGCDSSEDDSLLNPQPPDSTAVQIVNLVPGDAVSVTIGGRSVAANLPYLHAADVTQFLEQEPVAFSVSGDRGQDSVQVDYVPLYTATEASVHYFVIPLGESEYGFLSGASTSQDVAELKESGTARLFIVNGVDSTVQIRTGCVGGDTLASSMIPFRDSHVQDFDEGALSLYAISSSGREVASAHLELTRGEIFWVILAEIDGATEFREFPVHTGSPLTGEIPAADPEEITTSPVTVLNGFANRSITVESVETPGVSLDLEPLESFGPVELRACTEAGTTQLRVIGLAGDTTLLPVRFTVGRGSLVVVYDDGDGTPRLAHLQSQTGTASPGMARVRSANLSSLDTTVSFIFGAGGSEEYPGDHRPFRALNPGGVSDYTQLPVGTYPLIVERTASGVPLAAGIHSLGNQTYTLLLMTREDRPQIYVLDERGSVLAPVPPTTPARSALMINMIPSAAPVYRVGVPGGELRVGPVAYSYVYRTALPESSFDVTSEVGGLSVSGGSEPLAVLSTGESGGGELFSFIRNDRSPPQSKSSLRILSAAPGQPRLRLHIGDSTTTVVAESDFSVPSESLELDSRRYSFTVTDGSSVVAAVNGVELSSGRNYLLIVGPKGPTSSSSYRLATLFMQE